MDFIYVPKKHKNTFIVGCVAILLALSAFFIYRSITFRLVDTNPSANSVAAVSPFFKVNFNKDLAPGVVVSGVPSTFIVDERIEGSTVNILLDTPMNVGQTYTIHLSNIADKSGHRLPDKVFTFSPKDIASSDLPADQQAALAAIQQRYNHNILDNKLAQLLPFTGGGDEFEVSYTVEYQKQVPKLVVVITANTEEGIGKGEQWIRDVGFDPQNYTIRTVINANEE